METRKLLPLSGIIFVLLLVISIVGLGGSTPESDTSGEEVLSFYADEAKRQYVAAFLLAASAPFLVFFGMCFGERLRTDKDLRTIWERVFVAGSAVTAATVLLAAFVHFALAEGADQGVSPDAVQALNVLDANAWMPFNSAFGVMMLGAAATILVSAVLPRWLGWAALALGVLLFIPFADFFALIAGLLWIIAVSVLLYRAAPGHQRDPIPAAA